MNLAALFSLNPKAKAAVSALFAMLTTVQTALPHLFGAQHWTATLSAWVATVLVWLVPNTPAAASTRATSSSSSA